MTRKLEKLFDLPSDSDADPQDHVTPLPATAAEILQLDAAIDKIDSALPAVRGLESSDREMDELADLARKSYEDLMDLGMQVDSRFASDIFSVASNMLAHSITAKTAKLDKKLRIIDLQMKKMKLDQQADSDLPVQSGQGMVLSRNELLERILAGQKQNAQKE